MGLLTGILAALEPANLAFAALGVLVGMIVGIIPGLTSTMTIALFTPFALVLGREQGLALMLGVYNSVMFGGDITAILINIPGTPASIVATFDGYPMAKQGKAGLALGINAIAGAFGSVFGLVVLSVIAFPLARLALRFNSPEYFALGLFGLSMMVSVSGKSIVKGLMAGFLGMAIAVVGVDPISGFPRFTFGNLELMSGVSFVPLMIGLFGCAEILDQILTPTPSAVEAECTGGPARLGRIFPTCGELTRIQPALWISGVVGVFIGALPGAGGDIASLLSWDQSRRVSKKPEEFGNGSIEGLTAALSANNAVIGGALATMLTLGIPGDASTAVLIGTLLMWGLRPGPLFFRDHLDLFYLILGILLITTVLSFALSLARIQSMARLITSMPKNLLWAMVLLLCMVGSYALNNSIQDVLIMLSVGLVGLAMRRLGFPLGPTVLGLLLGPMVEANMRRSLTLSNGSWLVFFREPVACVLLVLTVTALVTPVLRRRRDQGRGLAATMREGVARSE